MIVSGYKTVEGEFHVRQNDWDSYDWDLGIVYQTSDGSVFKDKKEAEEYEAANTTPEAKEVEDLLNKALIIAKDYKGEKPNLYLKNVADALSQLAKDGGSEMLDKYYDSTCW